MMRAAPSINSLRPESEPPLPPVLDAIGLAFDRAGNLFVADQGFGSLLDHIGSVYKFTPTGVRTTFASGLDSPVALAFDSRGNLLVADGGMDDTTIFIPAAVYKFAPSGLRSTVASDNDSSSNPNGLAIDSADNLFVASIAATFLSLLLAECEPPLPPEWLQLWRSSQLSPTPTAAISDFNGDGHPDYVLS